MENLILWGKDSTELRIFWKIYNGVIFYLTKDLKIGASSGIDLPQNIKFSLMKAGGGKLYLFTPFKAYKLDERSSQWVEIEIAFNSVRNKRLSVVTLGFLTSEKGTQGMEYTGRLVLFNEKGGMMNLIDLPSDENL